MRSYCSCVKSSKEYLSLQYLHSAIQNRIQFSMNPFRVSRRWFLTHMHHFLICSSVPLVVFSLFFFYNFSLIFLFLFTVYSVGASNTGVVWWISFANLGFTKPQVKLYLSSTQDYDFSTFKKKWKCKFLLNRWTWMILSNTVFMILR